MSRAGMPGDRRDVRVFVPGNARKPPRIVVGS